MKKVNVVAVGKLKEKFFVEAAEEYKKRLSRFCKIEETELNEKNSLKEEAESILPLCKGYVIALAVEGKEGSSEEFAQKLQRLFDAGREVTFVIGSSCGLHESVKARADELCSFSKMTFPHRLMRVFLYEQVYRAFTIMTGSPYHK